MSRGANFSNEEIEMILSVLEKNPELVSGELTPKFPSKKALQRRWEELAIKLSASNMGVARSAKQIRNKWNDLKYRTKNKRADINKQNSGNSGGFPSQQDDLTSIENRIINLMGVKCSEGITNESFDSSTLVLQKLKNIDESTNSIETLNSVTDTSVDVDIPKDIDVAAEIERIDSPVIYIIPDSQESAPLATTKTSWPVYQSNCSSTLRGQKHREKKRKRAISELENFENEALATQKEVLTQVKGIADRLASHENEIVEIKDNLVCLNHNINKMLDKMDQTNRLLALALNVDDELLKKF